MIVLSHLAKHLAFITACCMVIRCDVTGAQQSPKPCGIDEFYDGVVKQCGLCRDICDMVFLIQSDIPCKRNCPEYYKKLTDLPNADVKSTTAMTSFYQSPIMDNMSPSSWMNHPLVWTIIVAILIAALATVAIAVLMVIFRHRKYVRYSSVEKRSTSLRDSSSSTSSDGKPNSISEPDVLVYESEKRGPPLMITSTKT